MTTNHWSIQANIVHAERPGSRLHLGPGLLVELPGIEPAIEITLTCRNAKLQYAKRRESTQNDLRIRERC
jgi:hypothetical protein